MSNDVIIRFELRHPDAVLPSRANEDDAGMDLASVEQHTIAPGERRAVNTGVAVAIPRGHGGLVLPRSGLALKHGISLVNAPGLIDAGYRGEIKVILLNTDRDESFRIDPGDRIAQLVIVSHLAGVATAVDSLDTTTRGERGFGSSG